MWDQLSAHWNGYSSSTWIGPPGFLQCRSPAWGASLWPAWQTVQTAAPHGIRRPAGKHLALRPNSQPQTGFFAGTQLGLQSFHQPSSKPHHLLVVGSQEGCPSTWLFVPDKFPGHVIPPRASAHRENPWGVFCWWINMSWIYPRFESIMELGKS